MKWRFGHLLVLLFSMPVIAVGVLSVSKSFEEKPLPQFGKVPPFELFERSGDRIGSKELENRVWIASFIFTSCGGQCPIITARMKEIQSKLRFKEALRLVSISVDPTRDTTKALQEYAIRYGADPYKWWFLTGPDKEIQSLVRNGFRLSNVEDKGEIIHSEKLVLVDHRGFMRGYYDANDDRQMKQIIRDAKALIRQVF